jgi:hypothetical protein
LYAVGAVQGAQQALLRAVAIRPELRAIGNEALMDGVSRWFGDLWIGKEVGVVDVALSNLPSELLWLKHQRSRIQHIHDRRAFFRAALYEDHAEVARLWPSVCLRDPGLLKNRGTWSVLCTAMVGVLGLQSIWSTRGRAVDP